MPDFGTLTISEVILHRVPAGGEMSLALTGSTTAKRQSRSGR